MISLRNLAVVPVFVAVVLLWGGGFAAAQEEDSEPMLPNADSSTEEELNQVQEMLEAEAEMMAGQGYSYDPGNRRDPFKSLLAARDRPLLRGPRPEGIPGLLIEETDLTGIFVTPEGAVAQVVSADQDRSYLLREGDQLYDGDVVRITQTEVVFKQILDDPSAVKPFREVVKGLNQ